MKQQYTVPEDGFRAVWFEGSTHREHAVIYMTGAKCSEQLTMTQFVIDNMNLQPLIDEVWYHCAEEDYAGENYAYRDFMRSWTHSRTATSVSIDEIIETGAQVDGRVIFDLPDPPNTYSCGSFVVKGTAVIGKE